jgi:xylulose-5-phosphate/fructose-6-phosphate phosphoketolase
VLVCCGDVPTVETLAAVMLLREGMPQLRVVNVVDLMRLQDPAEYPSGLSQREYGTLFPPTTPVIFALRGYPWLIHRLAYCRSPTGRCTRRRRARRMQCRDVVHSGTHECFSGW